jgi:hypothetical protein
VYTLVVIDTNTCTDTALVSLTLLQKPVLGANQFANFCPGTFVDLTNYFSVSGVLNSWTYLGNNVANPTSVNAAGVYEIVVTGSNGCADTANVTLSLLNQPILGANQQHTICDGSAIDLTTLYSTTGNSVNWMNGSLPVINPTAVSNAGVYTITATNASGCTSSANVTINLYTKPNLGLDQSITICPGTSIDLTTLFSLSNFISTWTENGNAVTNPTTITIAGNYQLIATDINGCSDTAIVSVTVAQGPNLGSNQAYSLCSWQTIDLSTLYNTSGLTTTYFFNGIAITNYTAVHDSGVYSVNVSDANGCTDEALVVVANVVCLCEANFSSDAKCMQYPISFTLEADSTIIDAYWGFSDTTIPVQHNINPIVKFNSEESVEVTMVATLSCGTVVVKKQVKVEDCSDPCDLFSTTAFFTNRNVTAWYGDCKPEEFIVEVYNAFGQILYSTTNAETDWSSKFGKDFLPDGIYIYRMEYRLTNQEKKVIAQRILLMR